MKTIETGTLYNIEDHINGRWILRYREWMSRKQAMEKYDWLTNSDYWLARADDYRIVELYFTRSEVERYKHEQNNK